MSPSDALPSTPPPSRLRRLLASEWLRPLNDWDAIESLLAPLDLTWSASRIRARVIATRPEAPGVLSVVLKPNARWPGFRAGQHLQIETEIDGRVLRRPYSLTSLPSESVLRITIRRQPGGRVSNHLHDHLRPGAVVTLGAPRGDFGLPPTRSTPLLMIAAGSGITPLFAMLADLHARGDHRDVVLLQICRSPEHAIFAGELRALAADWPRLRVIEVPTEAGRPSVDDLLARVPDVAQRQALVCTPDALLRALRGHWRQRGLDESRLSSERFGGFAPAQPGAAAATVRCLASGVEFAAVAGQPLLPQAERAGLAPRYGCRAGICHTCRYRKRTGVVRNLVTGVESAEPDELIQLCISTACSELELADL